MYGRIYGVHELFRPDPRSQGTRNSIQKPQINRSPLSLLFGAITGTAANSFSQQAPIGCGPSILSGPNGGMFLDALFCSAPWKISGPQAEDIISTSGESRLANDGVEILGLISMFIESIRAIS